jgi:hypothetical protein
MTTSTISGRGLAIAAGIGLYIGVLSNLFGADLTTPAHWSMHHYEVIITSAGTVAFGSLVKHARAAGMWLAAACFAALFVAGTGLVVYKSVGRQAAATSRVALSADGVNGRIDRKTADLEAARGRVAQAERQAAHEQAGRPDSRGRPTVKPGCGDLCRGWQRTAAEARDQVGRLEAELAALGPRQVAAPEAANVGKLAGVFGLEADKVQTLAILFVPVIWTLFLELGTIVCMEYGFARSVRGAADSPAGSRPAARVIEPAPAAVLIASNEDDPEPPGPGTRERQVRDFVAAHIARHGQPPRTRDVMRACALPKASASRWRARALAA